MLKFCMQTVINEVHHAFKTVIYSLLVQVFHDNSYVTNHIYPNQLHLFCAENVPFSQIIQNREAGQTVKPHIRLVQKNCLIRSALFAITNIL